MHTKFRGGRRWEVSRYRTFGNHAYLLIATSDLKKVRVRQADDDHETAIRKETAILLGGFQTKHVCSTICTSYVSKATQASLYICTATCIHVRLGGHKAPGWRYTRHRRVQDLTMIHHSFILGYGQAWMQMTFFKLANSRRPYATSFPD